MSLEEAKKESTNSDSNNDDDDDETHEINHQKKLEEDAKAEAAKQEGEYERYCDKILNRRAESRITNCDVLTKKGPITLKVYREDGTRKVIPNFKANDLQLGEWREVKRKHADDIHDYFNANKRLKLLVQYEDHLPSNVLNELVLGMIMFNSYHRQDFVTIEDLKDFLNNILYTIQEIFFRHHQGPGLDDHARTFSSLLLAEVDKRNLNPLKQIRTIKQLRHVSSSGPLKIGKYLHFSLYSGTETEDGHWKELQFSLVDNSKLNVLLMRIGFVVVLVAGIVVGFVVNFGIPGLASVVVGVVEIVEVARGSEGTRIG
ncbi:hypothetical protein Tco_0690143 [Tanacetum coccineum]